MAGSKARQLADLFGGSGDGGSIAPNLVSDLENTSTGAFDLPAGTTAQRPENPTAGETRFNTTLGNPEVYDGVSWVSISPPPQVEAVSPTAVPNASTSFTITISGSGFSTGALVSAIGTNNSVVNAISVSRTNSTELVATFDGTQFDNAYEDYAVKVENNTGLASTLESALAVNGSPVWSTSANLGDIFDVERSNVSIQISATDPEGGSVTYNVKSGSSLPTGLSINSTTGAITGSLGSVGTDTSESFIIEASDGTNTVERTFSLTRKPQVVLTYNYTGSAQAFTAPTGLPKFQVYMWGAGGTGGSSQGSGAGGDGGAGGYVTTTVSNFSDSQAFGILVGGSSQSVNAAAITGYGGGANGGAKLSQRIGGSGGGRSEIAIGWSGTNAPDGTRIVVAGGGGGGNARYEGAPNEYAQAGGAGGGLVGQSGFGDGTRPTGGTQSAGGSAGTGLIAGSANGNVAIGGAAGNGGYATGATVEVDTSYGAGGGGGGGYYGGGGGDGGSRYTSAQSGAGGSSYTNPSYCSNTTHVQGNGVVAPEKTNAYYGNGAAEGGSGINNTGSNGTAGGHGRVVVVY